MNQINGSNYQSIEQMTSRLLNGNSSKNASGDIKSENLSFAHILEELTKETGEIRFSKHASERMSSRNLEMTAEQMERLESGVKMAEEKGLNDSLVMIDNLAFIVNVPNNMVVTAVDGSGTKVFTNIDGAVIA